MSDIEDLNKTLYDMGAQDLLDVWNAMETEVGPKKGFAFNNKLISLL